MAKKKYYRALVGLTFPATAAALKKLKSGQGLSPDEWERVEAGQETCNIPAEAIKYELAAGHIEEVRGG